jgi:hypothetical protein
MKLCSVSALLLSLALAVSATSSTEDHGMSMTHSHGPTGTHEPGMHGNQGHHNMTSGGHHHGSPCKRLDALEELVSFANNATRLAKLPADEQTKIKALAANATAEITTLQSNATLASFCQKEKDCGEYLMLGKLSAFLSNATDVTKIESEMGEHGGKNATWTAAEIAALKANVTSKLSTLSANATLVNECKGLATTGTATGGATSATGTFIDGLFEAASNPL